MMPPYWSTESHFRPAPMTGPQMRLMQGFSRKIQKNQNHLGHRSAYATRTYAKVDLIGLRAVANFDLGGLV